MHWAEGGMEGGTAMMIAALLSVGFARASALWAYQPLCLPQQDYHINLNRCCILLKFVSLVWEVNPRLIHSISICIVSQVRKNCTCRDDIWSSISDQKACTFNKLTNPCTEQAHQHHINLRMILQVVSLQISCRSLKLKMRNPWIFPHNVIWFWRVGRFRTNVWLSECARA